MWCYFLINWCCKTLPICFFKTETKRLRKKEKSITRQESNAKPLTCNGNTLSIAPRNHCWERSSNYCIKHFCAWRDKLFKMAQKMQTYDEMSTTKGHPWVPQESQDFVLRYNRLHNDCMCRRPVVSSTAGVEEEVKVNKLIVKIS